MALTTLPLAGETLTAAILSALITEVRPNVATKTADQSVTSSTTLVDDNALTLAVAANTKHLAIAKIMYEGATAGDIKHAFTWPAGATFPWGELALDIAATTFLGDLRPVAFGAPSSGDFLTSGGAGAGNQIMAILIGTLTVGSTAGNLLYRFAQAASSATATIVKASSSLQLIRLS